MSRIRLYAQIERLRRRLNEAEDYDELLAISRRLDRLIVRYQRMLQGLRRF